MYDIITGMSEEIYDKFGSMMLDSFLKYWPNDLSLTVYTEDKINFKSNRINNSLLFNLDNGYKEFQESVDQKLENRCLKFSKKAFPIIKHLESSQGKLIWLDADLITQNTITYEWLDNLISPTDFSCHFGVPQGNYYSVETGFFIINRNNKYKSIFLEKYQNIYATKDFSNMHKPFDGDVFGRVIRECSSYKDFKFTELSPNPNKMRGPLNKVFRNKLIHLKGKKKRNYEVYK